jgi:Alpha-1,3-glucanase catalytic domain D1
VPLPPFSCISESGFYTVIVEIFRSRPSVLLGAALAALAACSSASAAESVTPSPPRETVAALDPALVAGRGASLGMIEQEAENATTNGTTLAFDTSAYTLAAEASGRRAVKLLPGQYVEFTLTRPANALTIRYSIPDAPTGGGIDAPLTLTTNDNRSRTLTLTSRYSWLYNQYPFSNDPNAGLLHPD